MDREARVRKIVEEAGCSEDVARRAEQEAHGDLEKAVRIARKKGNVVYSGGKSGLYVEEGPAKKSITQYKNGILVEDKFYDFSVDNNIRFKAMLEERTFDASLLGLDGETAEVMYTEKLDEEYGEAAKTRPEKGPSFVGEGRRLGDSQREIQSSEVPDMLEIAKDGDVLFKVMIGSKRVTVRMVSSQTVGDFFDFMEKYYDFGLILSSNGREVPPSHSVHEIANKLVFLSKR